jgi:hypothetical protein
MFFKIIPMVLSENRARMLSNTDAIEDAIPSDAPLGADAACRIQMTLARFSTESKAPAIA